MGSAESGGLGLLDCRIGSIVWVRRRNGSWWPGKILGTDELSASHLMSPRSGTPVKLLGREDASVDWYNLEKSKRVKTFRCGEFDDCIERAEASLGLPAKKREKYARREDAILHALELEKENVERNHEKVDANSSIKYNICGSAGKDLHTTLGDLRNGNGRLENTDLQQFYKKVVSPSEDGCNINRLSTPKGEDGAWQNSVNSESNTLIGDPQDFILPKKIVSAASSPSRKAASVDQAQAVSAGGVYGDVDSGNYTDKGKGLLNMSIEESNIKIRDRRRPLVHVLQNSTTWPGHSLQPEGDTFSMSGVNNSGEDAQMKRRRLLYLHSQFTSIMDPCGQMESLAPRQGVGIHSHADAFHKDAASESSENTESDSDSSETDSKEHYKNVEMIRYSDVHTPMELQSTALTGLVQQGDHASSSSEESDKLFPHDMRPFHQKNPVSLDVVGVSRWQMKGKRTARMFSRRSVDKFTCGTYFEPSSLVQRPSYNLSYYHGHDGDNEVNFTEDDLEPFIEGGGCGRRAHISKSQAASRRRNSPGSNIIDLKELTRRDSSFGEYRGDGFGGFHGQELLLDVGLKVQASHKREHVPFVSLMSRLNGKPIIGHPIQIETLGDGSTDALFSSTDAFENFENDDGNRVTPVWSTSRRTANSRAPYPHLSQLDDVDNQTVDQDQKLQFRKSVAAKKKNLSRRKSHQTPKLPSSEKKNPPKKSSSSSSQKIRPLSSLGMDQKLVSEPGDSGLIRYMDGAMKPLDSRPPIVACIPVKLVFSRLLESIGRPASMPSSHKGFNEQQ